MSTQARGVKLIFTGGGWGGRGHFSLVVAFKGPNVILGLNQCTYILGLYKCNYYLTRGKELGAAAW